MCRYRRLRQEGKRPRGKGRGAGGRRVTSNQGRNIAAALAAWLRVVSQGLQLSSPCTEEASASRTRAPATPRASPDSVGAGPHAFYTYNATSHEWHAPWCLAHRTRNDGPTEGQPWGMSAVWAYLAKKSTLHPLLENHALQMRAKSMSVRGYPYRASHYEAALLIQLDLRALNRSTKQIATS